MVGLVSLVCIAKTAYSQTRTIDSLQNKRNLAKENEKPAIFLSLAQAYLKISPEKSIEYGRDVLQNGSDYQESEQHSNALLVIGRGYYSQGHYEKALQLLDSCRTNAQKMGLLRLLATSNKLSAEIYASRNDYWNAYNYQKEYANLQDSLLNEETASNIKNLHAQHELESIKKENETLIAKSEKYHLYQLLFFISAFLLLAAISYAILQHRNKVKNTALLRDNNNKLTEAKQRIENSLNIFYDSEKRRKAILKAIPDSMFVCNEEGQLLDYHSRSNDLSFLKSEVMLGRSMDKILPDEFVKRAKKCISKANALGEIYLFEFQIGKDDNPSYFEARMGKSSENEFLFIIRDITERNKAKRELEKQYNFLQILIDDIPIPIFYKNKKGKYLGCNKEFLRIIGKERQQVLGKTVHDITADKNADFYHQKDEELLKEGGIQSHETTIQYVDGRNREVVFYKTVFFDIDGTVGGLVGSIVDVTESKQYEHTLKESEQKMRELNATKDKFFSLIAHDLKTPFNAIMGFSNLLYESYDSFDEEEKKEFIKNISEASDSTFKLLQNLLQWSRAQTGTIEMKPDLIDLSVIVNENLAVLKTHADNKRIKLQSHIDFGTTAYADANMITTVLRNFISNAIKFTYENGHIQVLAEKKKHELVVTVRDDGIGIDKENIDKVFRIDKQFKKEGTASEQGTGLGLILCKEFIECNNGKIWVESDSGKGSDFKFSLPKDKSAPKKSKEV